MTEEIVTAMRAEKATLLRRLDVVGQFLAVYSASPQPRTEARSPIAENTNRRVVSGNGFPVGRFTSYGASVIKAAISALDKRGGAPVSTRELVELIAAQGVEIRGESKTNALFGILRRSLDIKNHGRQGWTLADASSPQFAPNENEALNGHAASASEAGQKGVCTAPTSTSQPHVPQQGD